MNSYDLLFETYSLVRKEVFPNFSSQYKALKDFEEAGGEMLRVAYELEPNDIVFDLGGYRGEWTEQLLKKTICEVFVFEPISRFSEYCEEKFSEMKKRKMQFL